MKKRPDPPDIELPKRGRGRPPGPTPAKSGKERQEAYRTKLKAEGRKALHLWLQPEVIEQFDALRTDNATREETFERLVAAAAQRKR